MTFVEVRERNLPHMKKIPGQYLITDAGRVFYDNDNGQRIELGKSIEFILTREAVAKPNPHILYLELKSEHLIRYDEASLKWVTVGGLRDAETMINKLFEALKDLAKDVKELKQNHAKCMKILNQDGEIRLNNYMEYTMTVWGDTKIILPNVAKMDTGHIILWLSINSGKVDYGTTSITEGSFKSINAGNMARIEYNWNPLREKWVMTISLIPS